MAKPDATADLVRYEDDFHAWALDQVKLLERQCLAELDVQNLVDELRGLAVSAEQEIESRLMVLLQHLLKWQFQPEARSNSWRASILEQRHRINRLISRSPSLRRHPASVVDQEYRIARLRAADETGLPLSRFPSSCPYSASEIVDEGFWPGGGADFEE